MGIACTRCFLAAICRIRVTAWQSALFAIAWRGIRYDRESYAALSLSGVADIIGVSARKLHNQEQKLLLNCNALRTELWKWRLHAAHESRGDSGLLFSHVMAAKFGGKFGQDQEHITRHVNSLVRHLESHSRESPYVVDGGSLCVVRVVVFKMLLC